MLKMWIGTGNTVKQNDDLIMQQPKRMADKGRALIQMGNRNTISEY